MKNTSLSNVILDILALVVLCLFVGSLIFSWNEMTTPIRTVLVVGGLLILVEIITRNRKN